MADRTHSEIEDSRYGRYINLDILDDLLEAIHELKQEDKFILSLDESVESTLEDVLKSYLKWHGIKVIPNATGNNVFGTLHQSPSRLVLESEVNLSFSYFYDNLEKNIDVKDLRNSILSRTGLYEITFQSSSDHNDIFTAIMTVREYFRHQMKAHKDCVITVNNADMNTINALTNSNSTGLAVNVTDNKIDLDTLEDHCKESSEFISCIILPDDIENIEAVSNIVHKYNIKVIKIASYEDFLSETPLAEQGVDVIAFGPVATTHELHYYLPYHKQDNTGFSLGFGTVSQTAYNRKSIEICKLLEIDNANI
tara:strand:+ start:2937 stop:3866 length:930 start_codon:yes stop_codon:yes gene_type:complete